jgi:hypothetical protein
MVFILLWFLFEVCDELMQWYAPVFPALRRLKQEDGVLEDILGNRSDLPDSSGTQWMSPSAACYPLLLSQKAKTHK